MIYKDFVAEAAQKIMASVVAHKNSEGLRADKQEMKDYARGSVAAAKMLADALEEDWNEQPTDGGVKTRRQTCRKSLARPRPLHTGDHGKHQQWCFSSF